MKPFILAVFFIFFLNCSCKIEEQRPVNVLSEDSLKLVLEDMYLIEHSYTMDWKKTDSVYEAAVRNYEMLLRKYNIDTNILSSTIQWYSERPDKLKSVYENMITDMQERKSLLASTDSTVYKPSDSAGTKP